MNDTLEPTPGDNGATPNLYTSPLDAYLKGLREMDADEHRDAWASPALEPSDTLVSRLEDYTYALADVVDATRTEPGLGFNNAVAYVAGMARNLSRYLDGAIVDSEVVDFVAELAGLETSPDPIETASDGILRALEYAAVDDSPVTVILLGGFDFTGTVDRVPAADAHAFSITTAAGGRVTFVADDATSVRFHEVTR